MFKKTALSNLIIIVLLSFGTYGGKVLIDILDAHNEHKYYNELSLFFQKLSPVFDKNNKCDIDFSNEIKLSQILEDKCEFMFINHSHVVERLDYFGIDQNEVTFLRLNSAKTIKARTIYSPVIYDVTRQKLSKQ